MIGWKQVCIVYIKESVSSLIIVWRRGVRKLADMGSQRGLIVRFCLLPKFLKLGLQSLLPFGLSISLSLCYSRGTVLGAIDDGRSDDGLVQGIVIRPSSLDIRAGVGMVVGLNMRRNDCSCLEIWFADFGRCIREEIGARRTSQKNSNYRIPGE